MLHVHRADRADRLAGALADVLREPLADTFAAEVVAVPTRGVERWVAQQLSSALGVGKRADGVCANVVFPAPRRLVDEVVAAASGFDADRDPWLPQRLVWPLLETVDAHLGEPWLAQLHAHLDPGRGDRSRRLRVVAHLAALYDRYALYRPELLNGWQVSSDDDRWQAQLWRALRARVGRPGPAERLEATCRGLRANPELTPLPLRLSIFRFDAPAREPPRGPARVGRWRTRHTPVSAAGFGRRMGRRHRRAAWPRRAGRAPRRRHRVPTG